MQDEFQVMRSISREIGLTSHQLGNLLQEDGLRDSDGSPSMQAMLDGWVAKYQLRCGKTAYKWHRSTVLAWWKKRTQTQNNA
jgi:hypothetical protein